MSPRTLTVTVLGLAASLAAQAAAPALEVGGKAPALQGIHWMKGAPVAALEPGKTYVVEFWATWCAPCKASIPHLTELAKAYAGKVEFIGISIMEKKSGPRDSGYLKQVKAFVDGQGEKMVYHVGADGPEGLMNATWFKPSGAPGIPTAFIVNGKGQVAWTGHPMALDPILKQVVGGTYDLGKAAAAQNEEMRRRREESEGLAPFFGAMKKQDWAAAVAAGDKVFPRLPRVEANFGHVYYSALGHVDPERASRYARSLAGGAFKNSLPGRSLLVHSMLDNPKESKELIVEIAEGSLALGGGGDFYALEACALAYRHAGRKQEGHDMDLKALEAGRKGKIPEQHVGMIQARLDRDKAQGGPRG